MKESKMAERLQKVIAQAGVASRRKAEKMITAEQVTVNGKRITERNTPHIFVLQTSWRNFFSKG